MKTLLTLIARHWLPISVALLALISMLSLTPLEHLPTVPGSDKLQHFIAYAALIIPAALRRPRHLWLIFLFYVCWSGGIELIQPYVSRYGEWGDLAANTAGLTLGCVVGLASARMNK